MSIERKLLDAARRILYPLVRILLRNGISSDALTELVRKTYVDVAESEFAIEGRRQTTARISVITGLNRKEVARLRGTPPLTDDDQRRWNRAATVLGAWLRDTTFQDRKGDPLDLPFEANGEASFSQLCKQYSGDMQPRAIADELLRVGAVEEVSGRLRMTTRGYVPSSDPETVAEILGIDTAEFIETVDHNMTADPDEKLFQLKVLSDNVPAQYVDIGRAVELWVDFYVLFPVQIDATKCCVQKISDTVHYPSANDIILRLIALKHQPHRPNVIPSKTPIAFRVKIT